MNRTRSDPDAQLEASLRRISDALKQNRHTYAAMVEQSVAATGAEVAERVTARIAERHQRRMDRWQRREERKKRQRQGDPADVARGFVSAAAAVACLALAILHPGLWWLVFVAFGWGMSAASTFGRAVRARQAEREAQADESENTRAEPLRAGAGEREPAAPVEPLDPRVTRIQSLCDTILAELESGPPVVREVVTRPQATIGGLRQACLEIARRERELRTVLASQEETALVAERDALATRLSNEHDEIVRDRLGQALRALEQQLAHRAELTTAATRLEAENTRILYTLESLRMQLLRARSTDVGAPELGGKLRESLRDLGTEIDAVAEALEWASTPGGADTGTVSPGSSDTNPAMVDAERAERQAAARRAAQAREAQRH
jgi:hypothetical protein